MFVSKDIEDISDITIDEKINGEKCIDSKTGVSQKNHDRGENKISSHLSNLDKNGHTLRRRIDASCINENEDIGKNFRSEILHRFLSRMKREKKMYCSKFSLFRLY